MAQLFSIAQSANQPVSRHLHVLLISGLFAQQVISDTQVSPTEMLVYLCDTAYWANL
jgi:hypothetical protein